MKQLKPLFKWALPVILVGALVLLGVRVLRGQSQTTDFSQVVTVERGNLVATINPTGEVYAPRQAQLSFDVTKVPLIELNVTPGQQVRKGDVLARIDPSSLQRAVDQAKSELLSAEDALEKAKNPYTELDRQKAELDVALAEAALAEAKLDTPEKALQDAIRALQQAKDRLAALQNDHSIQEQIDRLQWLANVAEVEHGKLLEGPISTEEGRDRELLAYNRMLDAKDALEVAKARAALDLLNAQNEVIEAEETLAGLQAGLAQAQARNKVAQAEYNLAKAKDTLATILAGPDPKTVQLAQARYDAAKAALEDAQTALDAATMVAPFDGTVISVGAEVGDLVSSNITVVTLADLSNLRVLAIVDETDISQVEVGQEAEITFDAFPGCKFQGKVLEVPLEGKLVQNVVSYEVPVSLEGADDVPLRPGMTANVKIIVGRRQNALLLPVLAVQQGEEGNIVMVQDPSTGTAVATRVELGLSDGTYVEVLRGLNEGDQVVLQYSSTTQQTGIFRGFGGFFGFGSRVVVQGR
ncbi:MAG: efflux RND transporter periplasmic adaptor subunit [Chloroflexi bacterium]|nr:efflux RND transporter periplasmic adaptor subunit [Chloroflexota bacterium]